MASKMALYDSGYEDERFEQVVSQSFHCIICTNVFKDPVMCRYNEHLFCRACITIHLMNSQTCPTCMDPLTVDTLTQAPRGIRNLLSELKIRCEFSERGCCKFVELGDLERHVAECGFAPAVCSNQGCQLEVNKHDLVHHETAECKLRRVECHNCSKLSQEMDALKVSLAALNKKLERNEQKMSENAQRNAGNFRAMEQNLIVKVVELAQEQRNQQNVSNRHIQDDIVEVKKSVTEITTQLKSITQQASRAVQAQQEEMKKGIAEADILDIELMVVVAGGENRCGELNSVEMFSLSTQTWTPLQPMKECCSATSSVVYNNQVLVIGGRGSSVTTTSIKRLSTNAVRPDQMTWETLAAELPGQLSRHCSAVCNGRLLVLGGKVLRCGDVVEYSDSIIEITLVPPYTTEHLATMPQTRLQHGVAVFGGKVVIFGGMKSVLEDSILSSVVVYDITKNECKELEPLPYPVRDMATVKWGDDNIIIIGGADSKVTPLNKVVMYNIKTQMSHMLPDMKYKRRGCVAAVVRDTVIVMGGIDGSRNVLKSVESFRFDRYTWDELPEMHEARYCATAVVC